MSKPRFVTFYSYKGGVGRTLALGNVAWEAARNGKKVVIIDFDLEAPGISSIIPFQETIKKHISDKNKKGGLFEFILDFQKTQKVCSLAAHYTTEPIIGDDFKEGGSIYIIPAGKEENTYKNELQAFNWVKFYKEENGKYLLNNLRYEIISEFDNPDLVLIDSRTGLTDIGDICTILLPDKVVIFTGLNDQNIKGSKSVIDTIDEHSRLREKEDYLKPIEIILVASHVPETELDTLRLKRIEKAIAIFGRKIDVTLPYMPILSLEEKLLIQTPAKLREYAGIMVDKYMQLYSLISEFRAEKPGDYLKWIISNYGHMDADKLYGKGEAFPLSLPEIFVPLKAYTPGSKTERRREIEEKREPLDIEAIIAKSDYLLIEGQAGSGKTTLLKHLTYCLARKDNKGCKIEGTDDFLPLLILLKDLNNFFIDSEPDGNKEWNALDIMTWYFEKKLGGFLSIETVKAFLKVKRAIILLDGLDELLPRHRDLVVNAFGDLGIKHKGNKIILTSRPHGVEGAAIKRFGNKHIKILSLNMDQVNQFINKWFTYLYPGSSGIGGKTAHAMISEIKDHPAIEQLIDNPLMLTAICILYHDGKELPGQRAELYKKFIDNMLYRRFQESDKVHNFLKSLAFRMHEQGFRGVDRTFAGGILEKIYRRRNEEPKEDYKARIKETFDEIEPKCGLLKLEGGQYTFWHLTFQEFLTAQYIVDNSRDYSKAVTDYWENDWYREVIELYIGYLSIENKKWANGIIEDVIDSKDKSPFYKWLLASESLVDIYKGRRDPELEDKTRKRMLTIIDSSHQPKPLAQAGEILGWLDDHRDLKEFIAIDVGEYELENIGKVEIKPFEIGRYPVINAWFEAFIKGGGYKNKDCWSDEGRKWLKHTKAENPRYWNERKWKCPNSPVVGVTWYESYAFTRWLTLDRDDAYDYRLLTEREWQAAAAGQEGRTYPWGNEWDKDRCNNGEIKIEKTSPVGVFQQGNTPGGITDLSGNVWEWTMSDYHSEGDLYDFAFDKEMQELLETDFDKFWSKLNEEDRQLPVLRGGSWSNEANNCRCASRYDFYYPYGRDDDVGFRCARTLIL